MMIKDKKNGKKMKQVKKKLEKLKDNGELLKIFAKTHVMDEKSQRELKDVLNENQAEKDKFVTGDIEIGQFILEKQFATNYEKDKKDEKELDPEKKLKNSKFKSN